MLNFLRESYQRVEGWCSNHRILATAPVVALLLIAARPTPASLMVGAIIVVLGEAGRIWASGYIEKNAKLATAGPYRFTRNPLYFFNAMIFLGYCIMAANPWAAGAGLLAFFVIYRPAIKYEESFVRNIFKEEYDEWARAVPLFWPKWTGWSGKGVYSWRLTIQHREHKNALAMLAGILLFVAIHYWQQ